MNKEQRAWRDMAILVAAIVGITMRVGTRMQKHSGTGLAMGTYVTGMAIFGIVLVYGLLRVRSAQRADAQNAGHALEGAGGSAESVTALSATYARLSEQCRRQSQRVRKLEERSIMLANAEEFERRALAMDALASSSESERAQAARALRLLLESYPDRYRDSLTKHGAKKSTTRKIVKLLEDRDHAHWRDLEQARRMELEAERALMTAMQ